MPKARIIFCCTITILVIFVFCLFFRYFNRSPQPAEVSSASFASSVSSTSSAFSLENSSAVLAFSAPTDSLTGSLSEQAESEPSVAESENSIPESNPIISSSDSTQQSSNSEFISSVSENSASLPTFTVPNQTIESSRAQSNLPEPFYSYLAELNQGLSGSAIPDETKQEGFRDVTIIPDRKNTGIEKGIRLKSFDESGFIGTISEEEKAAGKEPLYLAVKKEQDDSFYNINGYSNGNCAEEIVIEGYNFEDAKFYTTNDFKLSSPVTITFKNCKFARVQNYPGNMLWMVFDHCQTEGNISGNNMILESCYLHANGSDATNPNRNMILKNCYVADLNRESSNSGLHIDGAQIFGDQYGGICENIIFDNVRFSIPQFYFEGSNTYVNAAFSTGIEFSEARNFLFKNIIIDTGGRWYPIYNTGGDSVLYKNIQVANGYTQIFYTGYINPNAVVANVEHMETMYVSSVWKDAQNHTHFLCSNNNMNSDKILKAVTDQGEFTFRLDRHPTPAELENDPVYRNYRFSDLPYDLEFIIEKDVSFIDFYDGDTKIRSVAFS